MARHQRITKPDYRFVVVDDTLNTWAVKDKLANQLVFARLRDPQTARQKAEELNIANPAPVDIDYFDPDSA